MSDHLTCLLTLRQGAGAAVPAVAVIVGTSDSELFVETSACREVPSLARVKHTGHIWTHFVKIDVLAGMMTMD